jgi:hypothetical protein
MPAKNNKLSPGRKNPANNPVSAKMIKRITTNPIFIPPNSINI